ncbi:MAG TPA: adenine deaminase C-terminal domain-containing protein [Pseudogracilibacillus sp.]|nr:adenine deaminase C-terminal domain-containing protein [Pseudogracilibacillus sp.]
MLELGQFWRNTDLRKHVAVVDEKIAPTMILANGTYLNVFTKQWVEANIWIYNERIVYVGKEMPTNTENVEIVDCSNQYLVPGYIEPHAHPYQLYNPEQLALHVAKFGTTVIMSDNLRLLSLLEKKKAFSIIENIQKMPVSMFWWGRYDSQSMLQNEAEIFNTNDILSWISHPTVVQGGELTAWPKLLAGDDRLLYWIQETKRLRKRVEGHLPGASEKTLTKLKLLGVSGDHEAMSGEEVIRRLQLGYHVTLRYSSIRPDLPKILEELMAESFSTFEQLMFTTDGATPTFYEYGMINICVQIAIEKGVPLIEAYRMATYNVAKYYGLDDVVGSIAPGRIAHINILEAKDNPNPVSVLAKGQWMLKDENQIQQINQMNWEQYEIQNPFDWDITVEDLQFSIPIGLKMENDVIMKPYPVAIDITTSELPNNTADAFLLLLDRHGKWRVNTVIHGFTKTLGALCSSYSATGDIILIGKKKYDMQLAFRRMKEIGGGLVIVDDGQVIFELPLEINGVMSAKNFETIIEKSHQFQEILQDAGYQYHDPIFCLLFLSSTHLPFIRVTQKGIIDVLKLDIIVPANMR